MNATQIRTYLPEAAWQKLAAGLAMPTLLVTPAHTLEAAAPTPGRLLPAQCDAMKRLLGETQVHGDPIARAAPVTTLIDRLRLRQGDTRVMPDAVLAPRRESDVVAVLRLCAENGIGVGHAQSDDRAHVALDLRALNRIQAIDTLSGQVQAGAGLDVAELENRLAERGLMLADGTAVPGITLASWAKDTQGLHGIRLATPMGLCDVQDDSGLAAHLAPFGIITGVTLRVRPRPAFMQPTAWHFPDFAAGLVALRQAARENITMVRPCLSDEQACAFHTSLQPAPSFLTSLWARLSRQNESGALLQATMTKLDQARFRHIARRLGAHPTRPRAQMTDPTLCAALLEHGAALDQASCRASWARLPILYARARAALETAMATHAPRKGARGLVLGSLSAPGLHDARLTLTWIFARKLGAETDQVQAIRASALGVFAPPPDALMAAIRRGIGRVLDPQGIIRHD